MIIKIKKTAFGTYAGRCGSNLCVADTIDECLKILLEGGWKNVQKRNTK
jgi:hypothetical protein